MTNPYYTPSGTPSTGAFAASAPMRSEFDDIQAGFNLLPALTAGTAVVVNGAGTALSNTVGRLALAGNFTTTGAFAVTLAASAAITFTLPAVSGTAATLAGTEILSNKTFVAPVLGVIASGDGSALTGTAASFNVGHATTADSATTATTATTVTTNANLTGMVTSVGNATTVVTNANLTGVITSSGNATSIASQTGTGTKFVVDTSPTLVTPILGVATGTSLALGGATIGSNALAITGTSTHSGAATFGVQQTTQGSIVLANTAAGSFATTLQSSNSASAAWTLTLPVTAGTSGYLLSTNGSGVTSWIVPPSSVLTVGSTAIASGTTTRILYDNAGTLGEYTITGTGTVVAMQTSPAFTTPSLGVATATSINGNTFTTGTYTLTGVAGKTLTFNKSLTLEGTDATTLTFPTTSATIARTDAGQTFTGTQTFGALVYTTLNGNTWATGTGTLSIGAGKTATVSNTLTFTGTDASSVAFGAGGTVLYTSTGLQASNNLSDVASVITSRSNLKVDSRTAAADTAPTVGSTDYMIAYTSLTTNRTVTLPAASTFTAGRRLVIIDESGSSSSSKQISLAPNGSDTIAGSNTTQVIINIAYGRIEIESNGTNGWFVVGAWSVKYVNTLSGDVALNNATYTTGPTIAQGTVGTWRVYGHTTASDSASAATLQYKLWDGTTVIDSCQNSTQGTQGASATLTGIITAPAGNIRIDMKSQAATTSTMTFNLSGNSKDCTLTVERIA